MSSLLGPSRNQGQTMEFVLVRSDDIHWIILLSIASMWFENKMCRPTYQRKTFSEMIISYPKSPAVPFSFQLLHSHLEQKIKENHKLTDLTQKKR